VGNARHLVPGLVSSVVAVLASLGVLDHAAIGGASFVSIYAAVEIAVLGVVALLFYALLGATTPAGRQLLDRLAGYRGWISAMARQASHGRGAAPLPPVHLAYALALGLDVDGWILRRDATPWFAGQSGPLSAGDLRAALRRRPTDAGAPS
jgi:hypothetical protein